MSAVVAPTEEEMYLLAILADASGLDLAEFCWYDPEANDGCFRARDHQWAWYTCPATFQVDQGARNTGKRLALDTRVPTPDGWTTMGALQDGDLIFDETGNPCTVTTAHPVEANTDAYEVVFSDGSIIVADAEHLWVTRDKKARRADARGTTARSAKVEKRRRAAFEMRRGGATLQQIADALGYADKTGAAAAIRDYGKPTVGAKPRVRTTREIADTLMVGREVNHSVDVTGSLRLPDSDLLLPPYYVGIWLGDGSERNSCICTQDTEIVDRVEGLGFELAVVPSSVGQCGAAALYSVRYPYPHNRKTESVTAHLRQLGVLEDKHIPSQYLRGSHEQRMELLRGLVDSDGHVDPKTSQCEISQCNERLARDIFELLVSLGEQPHLNKGDAVLNGLVAGVRYRVTWRPRVSPASLGYKVAAFKPPSKRSGMRVSQRRIVDVRPVPSVPMRCITVDSPNRQYLVGETMIPTHNTVGITMRAFAFPFNFEGQKMLLTAPELNHLRPLTDAIEQRLDTTRLIRELRPPGKGGGINKQPHWQARFTNGAQLVSRLPNKDGKGLKGQHVIQIELDEAQDFPLAGWIEVVETLNRGLPGAGWRCHGVPKGVRDKFYEITEGQTEDADIQWTVHRPLAMHRPSWSTEERAEKTKTYGGSRQSIDYKRNIYGEHGDATNAVFVIAKLMACVDTDEGSKYNSDVYQRVSIEYERLPHDVGDEMRQGAILTFIDIPGEHSGGWSQKIGTREVGAPKGYSAYWGGMDVGVTNHPSEILIFGQREGSDHLDLLLRVHMQRINTDDQKFVVGYLFERYGTKLKGFALDKTGVGFPIWDQLSRHPRFGPRIHGFNFSEKRAVAFEDRPLERGETQKDLVIERNVVEAGTDWLRNDYVDAGKIRLPYDKEVLLEFQGQVYCSDDLVEVLTNRGWLRYDEVRAGDRAVGLNTDGTSDWTDIRAVHVFPAAPREMLSMEHVKHSSLTTLDHRWYARRLGKNAPIEVVTSRDLIPAERPNRYTDHPTQNRWRIPIAAEFQGSPVHQKYDDDFVEMVAWFYTEGYWPGGDLFGFAQSPTANAENCDRIENLLGRMFGEGARDVGRGQRWHGKAWSVTTGRCNNYRVLDKETRRLMRTIVSDEKVVSPEFLASLTQDQLVRFIDVSLLADGCEFDRKGRVREFIQCHAGRTSSFEMACALAGYATRTRRSGDRFTVTVSNERYTNSTSAQREIVVHEGIVWCPETGTGNFLARRNGSVYFTGNSIIRDTGNPYGTKRLFGGGSFHCVDEETEILTSTGWKGYNELNIGDRALTLDMDSGVSRWSDVERLSVFSSPPELVRSLSTAHDSLSTPNHRWPVRAYDPHGRSHGPLKWKTTETLSVADCVPVAVPYSDAPVEAAYTDEFVELMAWFWTEGNMTASNTVITQSSLSENNVEEIRRVLTKEFGEPAYLPGGLWHEYLSGNKSYFILSMKAGCLLRALAPGRIVRPEFLLALTAEQLDLFIRTSEKGDGNHHPGSNRRAFQHLRDIAQARMLEMACALAGIGTNTHTKPNPESRSGTSTTVSLLEKRFVRPGKTRQVEAYEGVVWCPGTRDGNWLARRNGTVYWTGNTLDAAKMVMAGMKIPPLEAILNKGPAQPPILDMFVGSI